MFGRQILQTYNTSLFLALIILVSLPYLFLKAAERRYMECVSAFLEDNYIVMYM
jgi:hypothetical protein